MAFDSYGILRRTVDEVNNEIELIAAEYVRAGVPLWDAVSRAREEYKRRRAQQAIKEAAKPLKRPKRCPKQN